MRVRIELRWMRLQVFRPHWRAGKAVYTASSQIAARPNERRRNPRQRSSSLIYVQLGSDNGGIVTNLGVDGVAFQAARKLTEESKTILNLRLRGSGLDINLVGELIWLGATKKEAGIRFNEVPEEIQQGITDWIARESKGNDSPPSMGRVRSNPLPSMANAPAPGEKHVSLPLSSALAMCQESTVEPPPVASAAKGPGEPSAPVPADLPSGISVAPSVRVISPIEQPSASSEPSVSGTFHQPPNLSVVRSSQVQVESPLPSRALFEASLVDQARESAPVNLYPLVTYRAGRTDSAGEAPKTFHEAIEVNKIEVNKDESKAVAIEVQKQKDEKPARGPIILKPTVDLMVSTPLDKWVPPAVLAIWRRGSRQQRWAIAGVAIGCVWIFGMILILAVMHIASPSPASAGSGSLQQTQVRLAAPATETAAGQAAAAVEETEDGQPPPPPPTWFSKFGDFIFDIKPAVKPLELWRRPQINIDPSLVGVHVWTSKDSGYYYCTDSPFYMTLQPGSLMNQRDALQSGYQPMLGQFCN
jgi:hypothetical protein